MSSKRHAAVRQTVATKRRLRTVAADRIRYFRPRITAAVSSATCSTAPFNTTQCRIPAAVLMGAWRNSRARRRITCHRARSLRNAAAMAMVLGATAFGDRAAITVDREQKSRAHESSLMHVIFFSNRACVSLRSKIYFICSTKENGHE